MALMAVIFSMGKFAQRREDVQLQRTPGVQGVFFRVDILCQQHSGLGTLLSGVGQRQGGVGPEAHARPDLRVRPPIVQKPDLGPVGLDAELQAVTIRQGVHARLRLGLFDFRIGQWLGSSGLVSKQTVLQLVLPNHLDFVGCYRTL